MLLGREARRSRCVSAQRIWCVCGVCYARFNSQSHCSAVWSDFGGKREVEDMGHPERTAMREFREETTVDASFEPGTAPCLWNPGGRYLLFLVDIATLPHLRTQLHPTAIKTEYCWSLATRVVAAARGIGPGETLEGRAAPSADAPVTVPNVELFFFFCSTIARLEVDALTRLQ